jgi:hypothetical protein
MPNQPYSTITQAPKGANPFGAESEGITPPNAEYYVPMNLMNWSSTEMGLSFAFSLKFPAP